MATRGWFFRSMNGPCFTASWMVLTGTGASSRRASDKEKRLRPGGAVASFQEIR
jgi:hypothetical protein